MDEYSEADVRLVVDVLPVDLDDGTTVVGWRSQVEGEHATPLWDSPEVLARAILAALAGAGRLLPADARTETQWAHRDDDIDHIHEADDEASARSWAAKLGDTLLRRQVWVGPWVPVEPEAAGDGAVNGSLLLAFAGGFGESDSPQANPKALCSHCGQAGDLRPYGQDPTMLCADPCHDLVGGGHPATALRPGRGPCPDCTTEGAPSWDAVEKIARAHAAVARTRRPDDAGAAARRVREYRAGLPDGPKPTSAACMDPPAGEFRCRDVKCSFCEPYGPPAEPTQKGSE